MGEYGARLGLFYKGVKYGWVLRMENSLMP